MSNNKKTAAKKKSAGAKKKPVAKKKTAQDVVEAIQGKNIQIDVPTMDEVKDVLSDTFSELQKNNFKLTAETKKGFFGRIKSWFKVS